MSVRSAAVFPLNVVGLAAGFAMVLAFPAQAVVELVHWLRFAEWPNYDLKQIEELTGRTFRPSTAWEGANAILHWIWDVWVALPIATIAAVMFAFVAPVLRELNAWVEERDI